MAEVNKRQAFVIEGAAVLPNDRGTAPGQWVEESGAVVMLLPGPPHELKAMFERQCLPRLDAHRAQAGDPHAVPARHRHGRVATSITLIAPVYKKYDNPATTILAANGDLQIHLRARCSTPRPRPTRCSPKSAAPIELLLGDRLYSRNGDPLEVVVGEMLRKNHATVSVAESATGGMLGERFTSVPGSSEYFAGGFITYTNAMKIELLGVPPETLAQFGAVSKETAEAMAVGARRRTNSTYALSITGVAGPDTDSAPVGTMYVGLADAAGTQVVHRQFLGDRQRIRIFTCQMALDLLRRRMARL